MNKEVADTTATDAAAPAVAPTAEPVTPADPLHEMDEPCTLANIADDAPLSDVVELSEHFETDAELAELSVRLLNLSQGLAISSTYEDDAKVERAVSAQRTAALPSLVLMSRALMRSAAAHERMAASNEQARRAEAERHQMREEMDRLQLDNLRLQNKAFRGHVDRIEAIAQYAVSFAQQIRAGKLAATSTDPISDYQEFASQLLRLAGEEMFLAESDAKPAPNAEQPA